MLAVVRALLGWVIRLTPIGSAGLIGAAVAKSGSPTSMCTMSRPAASSLWVRCSTGDTTWLRCCTSAPRPVNGRGSTVRARSVPCHQNGKCISPVAGSR